MAVKKLNEIKAEEGRDLDSLVDSNTLTSGEQADGTFGVFKFFQGIKNFFKGIQALGTLASGSRLPVTDANGNVSYTTMNDINNYVINNALADFTISNFNFNPTTIIADNKIGSKRFNSSFNPTNKPTAANFFYGTLFHNTSGQYFLVGYDYTGNIFERRYLTTSGSWENITEIATKSDLRNYTARIKLDHGQNTSTQYLRLLRIKKGNQWSIGYSNFILSGINAYGIESAIIGCCINSRRTPDNWKVNQIIPLMANGGGASNLKYTETDTHYEVWVQLPSYHAGITITKLDEYLSPDYIEWAVTIQNSINNAQDIPNMS